MTDEETPASHGEPSRSPSHSQVRVRRATDGDAAVLHRVAAATFALACPPETTQAAIDHFISTNLSERNFADYLADENRALMIAEVDGEPAGYTMVNFGEPTDGDVRAAISVHPTSELSKVYVLAGHHGAGVAPIMVEASVEIARARGAAAIWLGVNQKNARANRFYEKSGFALVGTKRFLVGEKYEDDFVRERVF